MSQKGANEHKSASSSILFRLKDLDMQAFDHAEKEGHIPNKINVEVVRHKNNGCKN